MESTANRKQWDPYFKVNNFITVQINILKFLGMWPIEFAKYLPKFTKPFGNLLTVLYFIVMAVNLLHLAICQVKTLYDNWGGHLDDISNYMQTSIIYVGGTGMTVYYQLRYRIHREMVDYMNAHFLTRSAPGLTFVTLQSCYESSRKYSIYWVAVCTLGTFHMAILPILHWKRVLPLITWYPFDTSPSPRFEFIYICQFVGQIQIGMIYSIYGAMWMSCIMNLCGQYDIVFCEIKNMMNQAMIQRGDKHCFQYLKERQRALKFEEKETNEYYGSFDLEDDLSKYPVKQSSRDKPYNSDNLYKEFDSEILEVLKNCIRRHHQIIKMSALIERFFSLFLFGKLFIALFLICFFLYTSSVDSSNKVVNILEYLGLTMTELLMLCYFPAMLIEQVRNIEMLHLIQIDGLSLSRAQG